MTGGKAANGEVRVLAATGVLGSGFKLGSLKRGLEWSPDFIGCDAGSTDGGPYYLGSGSWLFAEDAVERDIRHLVEAAREHSIPLLIGSAGTSGADAAVSKLGDMTRRVATELGLRLKLGLVFCEPSVEFLKQRWHEGRIHALANAPDIDETSFDRGDRIVAMAGVDAFTTALELGADVVICGRASDTAIFAAIPIQRGIPPGVAFHAAKILECGAAAATHRAHPDSMFAVLSSDGFSIEPPNPAMRCTPVSVASHALYENDSPYELPEPTGVLRLDDAQYEALSDRSVRVTGSRFEPASQLTAKLEAAREIGHQAIVVGGIRDRVILDQLDGWLEGLNAAIWDRFADVHGADQLVESCLTVRRYGLDAVMGSLEPTPVVGHEVGLVFEVTAPTQQLAVSLAKSAAHIALHHPIPDWTGLITSLALPHSPPETYRGVAYRFTLNHVVELDDPMEPFRVEIVEV